MRTSTTLSLIALSTSIGSAALSQKPADTEVWKPVPAIVTPGRTNAEPPSDAIILFDGRNLDEWVLARDGTPARWTVDGGMFTVNKPVGDIRTKRLFGSYQMHIEWRIPEHITGKDQARGNSGVYLAWWEGGGYELQILDSYDNTTYVNGQAGSIYKQYAPLVNANRKPGEWQTYDIVWTAPTFKADGTVETPASLTALHNGVLVQDHAVLRGVTKYTGQPEYTRHGPAAILLQAHGDPSPPISFRNIWVRELKR